MSLIALNVKWRLLVAKTMVQVEHTWLTINAKMDVCGTIRKQLILRAKLYQYYITLGAFLSMWIDWKWLFTIPR